MARYRRPDLSAWGAEPPVWVQQLAGAVADIGQQAVADRLGYSRPAISLALSGHYPGSTDRLAARIERIYGNPQVLCPHFQTLIPLADCKAHQQRPYNPANADRLRLYLACRRCPLATSEAPHE